jgi:hypothetical protein
MLSIVSVFAQPRVHVGITSGFNSTYVLDKGFSENPLYSSKANYEWAPVGASVGIDLSNRFGFQLESIKAAQGQIYQIAESAQQIQNMIAERNIDLTYLQFPLLMKMMSGSNKAARFNFQLGPQLSLLSGGSETMRFVQDASINLQNGDIPLDATTVLVGSQADIPASYQEALANGSITPPSDNSLEVPLSYFQDAETQGQYNMPENAMMTLMTSETNSEIQKFKDKEIQLAFGFGMDIDVWKQFYISANVRANYSFTDMRNQDLIDMINDKEISGIFNNRANLLIGAQIGLHWAIGGNRSSKAKKEAENDEIFR